MQVQLFPVSFQEGTWKVFVVNDDGTGDMIGHYFTTKGGLYSALDIAGAYATGGRSVRGLVWEYKASLDYYTVEVPK